METKRKRRKAQALWNLDKQPLDPSHTYRIWSWTDSIKERTCGFSYERRDYRRWKWAALEEYCRSGWDRPTWRRSCRQIFDGRRKEKRSEGIEEAVVGLVVVSADLQRWHLCGVDLAETELGLVRLRGRRGVRGDRKRRRRRCYCGPTNVSYTSFTSSTFCNTHTRTHTHTLYRSILLLCRLCISISDSYLFFYSVFDWTCYSEHTYHICVRAWASEYELCCVWLCCKTKGSDEKIKERRLCLVLSSFCDVQRERECVCVSVCVYVISRSYASY